MRAGPIPPGEVNVTTLRVSELPAVAGPGGSIHEDVAHAARWARWNGDDPRRRCAARRKETFPAEGIHQEFGAGGRYVAQDSVREGCRNPANLTAARRNLAQHRLFVDAFDEINP